MRARRTAASLRQQFEMVEQHNTAVGRPRGSIGRIGLGLSLASLAAALTLSLFNPG